MVFCFTKRSLGEMDSDILCSIFHQASITQQLSSEPTERHRERRALLFSLIKLNIPTKKQHLPKLYCPTNKATTYFIFAIEYKWVVLNETYTSAEGTVNRQRERRERRRLLEWCHFYFMRTSRGQMLKSVFFASDPKAASLPSPIRTSFLQDFQWNWKLTYSLYLFL